MSELDELTEELKDVENVEDEEEDIVTTSDLFSISSYGVDYPVQLVVERMRNQSFYIPDFQRQFVWSQNQSSRFIESLLMGLPVPGVFLFRESISGRHLIIDGQQRLKSLQYYYDGKINGRKFALCGLKSDWDGKTFYELGDDDQLRLSDAVIHVTVFKQDSPKDQMNSVYEVFERLNTGGLRLSPQEIRSCIFHGNFNNLLLQLNEDEAWRSIYGQKSKRLKDIEAILRFLAFYEQFDRYSAPMKHFLNNYMEQRRNCSDAQLMRLAHVFSSTMKYSLSTLGKSAFRPERALNVAVFDSVATSIAHMIGSDCRLRNYETKEAYDNLLKNNQFRTGYTQSTSDRDNVKNRFEAARSAFGVL